MDKPKVTIQKAEHTHINWNQEVAYSLLLDSINNIIKEEYGENINSVIDDLMEGLAGHHSKLTIQELASILVGELRDIFQKGQ